MLSLDVERNLESIPVQLESSLALAPRRLSWEPPWCRRNMARQLQVHKVKWSTNLGYYPMTWFDGDGS